MDNMNKQQRVQRRILHGFTLIEMMVVIAILVVLIGVLVPAMSGYITKSRLNSANGDAKVLFNSLQTICQEYEFADRSAPNSSFYGSNSSGKLLLSYDFEATPDGVTGINMINVTPYGSDFSAVITADKKFMDDRSITYNSSLFNDDTAYLRTTLNVAGSKNDLYAYLHSPVLGNPDANDNVATTTTLRARLERLYEENKFETWIAVIDGYQVRATFCATSGRTNYVGAYPLRTTEKNGIAVLLGTNEDLELENLITKPSSIADYLNKAWGTSITLS